MRNERKDTLVAQAARQNQAEMSPESPESRATFPLGDPLRRLFGAAPARFEDLKDAFLAGEITETQLKATIHSVFNRVAIHIGVCQDVLIREARRGALCGADA